MHVSDEQLMAQLAGEGDDATQRHVETCGGCRARLAELAALERRMVIALQRITCPEPLALFEHVRGRRPSTTIAHHLAPTGDDCPRCQAEVAALARWETLPLAVAPPHPSFQERLRRVVATLVPTGEQRPLPALRGEGTPVAVYEAGDVILTLDPQPTRTPSSRKALHGFVLALDGDPARYGGASVRLSQAGTVIGHRQLSALGGFVFDDLEKGEYRLVLTLPTQHIVVDDLIVR